MTTAEDQAPQTSVLPMGSLFKAAQLIFFDLISNLLQEPIGQPPDLMWARHTNLK